MKKVLGRGLRALMPERSAEAGAEALTLDIAEISVNKFQPRQQANQEKMEELIASIKEKGVIQPILVRSKESGGYELIAGERRLRAARELGFTQLPAVIKDVDDAEALQLALIENIQREDLNPLEEAQAYRQLITEFGYNQEKVARTVGKDASSVSNTLRLLKLPAEIQSGLRKGMISMGHARTILAIKSLDEQGRIFQRTLSQRLSVRELEHMVTRGMNKKRGKGKKTAFRNPHFIALEEQIQQVLGTKVKIIVGRKRGKIILEYYSDSDLERIIKLFKSIK
jgi:ParB family chromosome partitioning protein